jgi:hypothetical protein
MMRDLHEAPESLFWYWIAERHRVFLKRQAGLPKPWTADPILQDYKFTNPFRENDRGTVWLRENFLKPHRSPEHAFSDNFRCAMTRGLGYDCDCGADKRNLQELAFNIGWYRMFNWWGTGEALGWQTSWDVSKIRYELTWRLEQGEQVFTGAHIVYSRPGLPKVDAIVDVCEDLWHLRGEIADTARETKSLQTVFDLLNTVDCVGGFMGYEMVTDMRHTRLLEDATDIMTWANMGPGAQRGLRRLGYPAKNQKEGCESMRILLEHAPVGIGAERMLHGWVETPELEMRDIEHSLCEFDKYCRVKFGEGTPRGKFNGR